MISLWINTGVRALSILWVMLGHAIAELNVVGFSNPSDALPPRGMTHTVVREDRGQI